MTTTTTNHQVEQLGAFEDLLAHALEVPGIPRPVRGKVFLKRRLGLTGMEVSVNRLPAGVAVPFLHRHRTHEELFLVVGGRGELIVDGQVIPLTAGTAVRVAPDGARALRSAPDAPLDYVCVQVRADTLGDVETIQDGVRVDGPVPWPGV